jgi:hypothetical protein
MAFESYIKALVGNTPDVQIVSDNSSSELPHTGLMLSPRRVVHSEVASSSYAQNSVSRSQDGASNCACSPQPDCPLTPIPHRSILEDFRERQKLIRMSMSPGVWPDRSPRTRPRGRSSPPPPNATNSPSAKKDRVRNFKQKLPDVELHF